MPDGQTERCGKPGPLPSPPERSVAKRRRRSGEGQARAAKRARIGGGHQSTGILSGFTGHEHDPDLGLINMKGRIYDPAIGRFISADPYIQYPFWGQGLNRYSYGFNNPMSGSDPTGFGWFDSVFGDSSGWEVTAAVGGLGAIVGGAAYASYLAQGGSVSAGGLAGASGLGGAYAIGEAFAGLNDPGANATYAAPTGELGQGALYYDGAVAPSPQTDSRTAAIPCGTPERCQQLAMAVNTMGPMGGVVTGARATGGLLLRAWRWVVGRSAARGVPLSRALEAGPVKPGGKLAQVLGGIEKGYRAAGPKNALDALSLVKNATSSAGLEAGVATVGKTGEIVLQNVGGITVQVVASGTLLSFRLDGPVRSILYALWTRRSRMASARLGSPIQVCHPMSGSDSTGWPLKPG